MDYNDYVNKYNNSLKGNSRVSNNIEKDKENIKDLFNKTKYVDHHEHVMEVENLKSGDKAQIRAIFRGVKYRETSIANVDVKAILNAAIESYFMTRPIKKVVISDFIAFVKAHSDIYKVEIESIEAIDLQITQTLSQTADFKKPVEIFIDSKKRQLEVEIPKIPNEMNPYEKIIEVQNPTAPSEYYPSNFPMDAGVKVPQEVKTRKNVPQEEQITMGME